MKNYIQTILVTSAMLAAQAMTAQCTAGFTAAQSQNNIVDFTNTSTPIIPNSTMFWWDFGDQQYDYTQNPSHTYSAPGTYYVCVNMYDSLSMCQSQFCDTVTVWGSVFCNMTVSAFPTQQASCATCADGEAYVMPQFGTAPYTYSWSSGGNGQVETGLLPGSYAVCVTDANGCTACDSVMIVDGSQNSCVASFNWSQTINNTIDFFSNSTGIGPNTFYFWSYGDNSNGYGQSNTISHFYNNPGTYLVCLTIMDSTTSCMSTFCDSVTVFGNNFNPVCDANFVIYPDSVNTQQAWAYNLSTGGPGMTYDWNWGDNTAHDYTAYPSHIYQYTGTYNICLIVNDAANQCSDTMCQMINVYRITQQAAQVPYYVNVIPSGIISHEKAAEWNVYPNPAKDNLRIHSGERIEGRDFRVMDISGRMIMHGKLTSNSISISSLESGTYILQLVNENGTFSSQRFIKQ